jgi:HEAT repeat protein
MNTKHRYATITLVILYSLWGVNALTGVFSKLSLSQKEYRAIEYGENSKIYKRFIYELIFKTKSALHWERKMAATELGHLNSHEETVEINKALIHLLQDEHSDVRREATFSLTKLGYFSDKTLEILLENLEHGDYHDKYKAIQFISLIGKDAKKAIPLLKKESKKEHPKHEEINIELKKALQKLGDKL